LWQKIEQHLRCAGVTGVPLNWELWEFAGAPHKQNRPGLFCKTGQFDYFRQENQSKHF
jgi:hypothetical protein